MNWAGRLLKRARWTFAVNLDMPDKCVICVAPHTSNWDFILGEISIRSVGKSAHFLMKDTWFKFPLGPIMRRIGGIPVKRSRHTHVTDSVVNEFNSNSHLWVAVTPEGTRSANPNWHKGFLHIAQAAKVPVLLAYIDYAKREVCIDREFEPTGDTDADIVTIKKYYASRTAKYPEKFTTGLEKQSNYATPQPQRHPD